MFDDSNASDTEASWKLALDELTIACCAAMPAHESTMLARLCTLLTNPPSPDLITGIELLEACGVAASDTTVSSLRLLGADCSYMLSRGPHALHIASVVLPGSEEEASSAGSSLALALIGAIAIALTERCMAARTFQHLVKTTWEYPETRPSKSH